MVRKIDTKDFSDDFELKIDVQYSFSKMNKSEINSIMHLWHFHVKSKTITAAHIKNAISFVDYR